MKPPAATITGKLTARDLDRIADAVADRIADRIADRLNRDTRPAERAALVDAHTLADLLGVTAAHVRENAERYGAIRIGNGPRPLLRFDPATAIAAHGNHEPATTPAPRPQRRRPQARTTTVELLPFKGQPQEKKP